MFIIGITGGSGAGKTSALRALEALGALVLDCDAIYHELLTNNAQLKSDIGARFEGVLVNGFVDRRRLGDIVFSDRVALCDLNAIAHAYVKDDVDRRISEWTLQGGEIAAVDAIALIESGRAESCDITVGVTALKEARIARIINRDGISHEKAELRVNAQKPDSFYVEHCDYIIENNFSSPTEFEGYCKEFFKGIIEARS